MQETLRHVSEVTRVERATAESLGFAVGDDSLESFHVGEDGLVEIPRWRHALINYPHPLLKQGLVVLDTPGLNAIGAEPELTLSLLPTALGLAGPLYGVAALALGGMFLVHAVRLWREDRDLLAMRTFRFSIIYLFALFAALALDRVVQDLLVG